MIGAHAGVGAADEREPRAERRAARRGRWLAPQGGVTGVAEGRVGIGLTHSARKPAPEHRYSGRQLRHLFSRFIEHRVYQRQLRRSEIPYVWRFLPTPLLSRMMGRILVLKAFKPVRASA